MITNHLTSVILSCLRGERTPSQEQLAKVLAEYTMDTSEDALLVVKGYAGTGKTSMISAYAAMLDSIQMKFVLLAPTGRAAKVLSSYSGHAANTIHKKIYRQKSSKDGMGKFVLDRNLHTRTVFIVDEASMISGEKQENSAFGSGVLLDDLIEYVYNGKGCKLILAGDTAQLPPVGVELSPALSESSLSLYSDTIYTAELHEVVRQKQESGILFHATRLREKIDRNDFSMPLFMKEDFKDICRLPGDELLETLTRSYEQPGMEDTIIISRSNKRANKYNEGIRQSILYREAELAPRDYLMVVRNNYYWLRDDEELGFIANGDIMEVVRIKKYLDLYGFRFAECTVRLVDYDMEIDAKIMLDVLTEEAPALSAEKNRELYFAVLEDYAHLKPKKKQYEEVRNNAYFNAIQVKFAYAVTCHKSQGGQWKTVFIDQGYQTQDGTDREYLRWLYTALTRATDKVYLVNFPDWMFQD